MPALLDAALAFAAVAHQGQKRKGTAIPYIVHPVGVMVVLLQAGETDAEVLAAALLHDTVEDAGIPLTELRDRFGERVAAIVEGCSEPDKSAAWEARMGWMSWPRSKSRWKSAPFATPSTKWPAATGTP